jgi:hypothetical protein
MESYHSYSDVTMDTLLEFLEELLDSLGNPSYEVEYHVREAFFAIIYALGCDNTTG